jgi:predicted secreted protein with PEFG-CTERM motif
MKIQNKTVFPVIAVFAIAMTLAIQPAFAENVSVNIPAGSSTPGCEKTSECFIPDEVSVNVGDEVTWTNDDTAAHTVTAGSAANGPSGVFDSSLFMAGTTFSHKFDAEGEFPYFCMVHPWMTGLVKVSAAGAAMPTAPMDINDIMAEIKTSDGMANTPMSIDLTLTDLAGNSLEHITYHIKATQGSNVVLDEDGHMHMGTMTNTHTTEPLPQTPSDSMPVVITVESVGFGHNDNYVAVPGEISTKQVVPEFGTIAAMVLAVAIISIIAVSAKSKLSVMPRL